MRNFTYLWFALISVFTTVIAGTPVEVQIFNSEEFSYGESYEEVTVHLPENRSWTRISYTQQYIGGIGTRRDNWDRIASTHIVTPEGLVEISRDITDYGFTTVHTRDVSKFARLLDGNVTFRLYLTTWTSGDWEARSVLTYYDDGRMNDQATFVIPVTGMSHIANDANPGSAYTINYNGIQFPPGLTRVHLFSYATGHSQAEEFGPRRTLTYAIDGVNVGARSPWNTNCDHCDNHGTKFDRSGWCPGAPVPFINFETRDPLLIASGDHNISIEFNGLRAYWMVGLAVAAFIDTPTPTPSPIPTDTVTPVETATEMPTRSATPTPQQDTPTPYPTYTGIPPSIPLAGYWNTNIPSSAGLQVMALVQDRGDGVSEVELYYQGTPIAALLDDGSQNDFSAGDGLYGFYFPVGDIGEHNLRIFFEVKANGRWTGTSQPWPFLSVDDR